MELTADYHTHTKWSDGKTAVLENVERAKALGMAEIAITEHGYSHWFFGLKRKETDAWLKELRAAADSTGMRVLAGMENNIRGISGKCDFTEADYENFDIFLAGIHVVIRPDRISDIKFGWGGWIRTKMHYQPSARYRADCTRAYINAIERNPVDILTHLNFLFFANAAEVAKCCRDYGTYIEISSKKPHLTDDELAAVAATGVRFVVNSDAHTADRIGDTAIAEEQILRVGVPLDRIDNIDGRMPKFRFAEYKQHM